MLFGRSTATVVAAQGGVHAGGRFAPDFAPRRPQYYYAVIVSIGWSRCSSPGDATAREEGFAHDEGDVSALCAALACFEVPVVAIERPDGLLLDQLLTRLRNADEETVGRASMRTIGLPPRTRRRQLVPRPPIASPLSIARRYLRGFTRCRA
jgi:hypothetical protein